MWLASTVQLFALMALGAEAGPGSPVAASTMPECVATRQTLFAIPFRIDPADHPSREPVEVQLWVSGDRGRSWQLYSRVEPARRQFMFRAGADGEFWFQVRTLDRSGQLRPARSKVPRLRVVVDTAKPKLQLQAHRGQAGQITARWQVDEPNPKPDSLKIQYRTTAKGPLQSVAIGRANHRIAGSTQTGEVTWWPQAGSGVIQIRAEVTDMAGNPAVSHAQTEPNQQPAPQPGASPDPAPGDGSKPPPDAPGTGSKPPPDAPGTGSKPPPDAPGSAGASPSPSPSPSPWKPGTVDNGTTDNGTVSPHKQTGVSAKPGLPPGLRPRMLNSRLFPLEYDVESVGPSGIARVELFGTRDGGQTWRSFTVDADNRSPVLVQVDGEGTYGFRIVVKNGAGLSGKPPQSGDRPEVVIGVDLTKPTAQIVAAEKGTGAQSGQLIISWRADDKMLAARPVSLSFSEGPGKMWTPIASGLENTGRYAWPLDSQVPEKICLRLEVRDEAGNVGVFETAESVALDRPWPAARLRGAVLPR